MVNAWAAPRLHHSPPVLAHTRTRANAHAHANAPTHTQSYQVPTLRVLRVHDALRLDERELQVALGGRVGPDGSVAAQPHLRARAASAGRVGCCCCTLLLARGACC